MLSTIGYTLADLASLSLILSLLNLDHPLASFFNQKPLRRLGEISYGFYVFHDMFRLVLIHAIQHLLGRSNFPHERPIYALAGFCLTLLLATLSFRFYEKPFLRLKARYAPTPHGSA